MSDNRAVVIAIWVAVIGFLGTVFQGFNQSWISARQEERRLQSELIIRAVETTRPAQALQNLRFLLNTGLITDEDGRLTTLVKRGEVNANFSASEPRPLEQEDATTLAVLLEGLSERLERASESYPPEQADRLRNLAARLRQLEESLQLDEPSPIP